MLYLLEYDEFSAISRQKREQHDHHAATCWRVVGALTACWMQKLGSQKLTIMMFLVNRTLYYRKEAEQIWSAHWREGVVDGQGNSVCDAIGMAESTFRKHLNDLIEDDFVTVWACRDKQTGAINQARLFAINCKKVLQPYTTEGSKMAHLRLPKSKNKAENDPEGSTENQEGGLPKSGRHNSINNRLTKVNLSGRAPHAGTVVAGTTVGLKTPKQKKQRAYEDETPAYVDPEVSVAPREIVEAIQRRTTKEREARVAAAATVEPWKLTQQQMQALFDKAMKLYFPSLPRVMVTGKEYGLLKKRLKETQPKDFAGFIDWAIRMWTDTVSKHRKAIMRGVTNGDESKMDAKPMPGAPDFATLVYRLPYFLKVHSSFLADQMGRDTEDKTDRRVARLERELAQERNTNRILSERAKTRRSEPEANPHEEAQQRYEAPATRLSRTRPTVVSNDDLGPDTLPEWQDMGDGGYDIPRRNLRYVR